MISAVQYFHSWLYAKNRSIEFLTAFECSHWQCFSAVQVIASVRVASRTFTVYVGFPPQGNTLMILSKRRTLLSLLLMKTPFVGVARTSIIHLSYSTRCLQIPTCYSGTTVLTILLPRVAPPSPPRHTPFAVGR